MFPFPFHFVHITTPQIYIALCSTGFFFFPETITCLFTCHYVLMWVCFNSNLCFYCTHSCNIPKSSFNGLCTLFAFKYCNKSTKLVVHLLLTDGQRVANSTLIDTLLEKDFKLVINDGVYNVSSPEKGTNTFLSVHTVRVSTC